MPKIIIQKDNGEEVKTIRISSDLRNPDHALSVLSIIIADILNTLNLTLDLEQKSDRPQPGK